MGLVWFGFDSSKEFLLAYVFSGPASLIYIGISDIPCSSFLCLNMVTRKVNSGKEKAVLVSLYVENPKKRLDRHHHHQHHLLHHDDGKGYSRRALLLHYSQSLRKSARSEAPSSDPKTISSKDQQPTNKIAAGQSKRKHEKQPTCLGDCKLPVASLLRSFTILQAKELNKNKKKKKYNGSLRPKIKGVAKNFKVQKTLGFISKIFKPSQKHY